MFAQSEGSCWKFLLLVHYFFGLGFLVLILVSVVCVSVLVLAVFFFMGGMVSCNYFVELSR